MRGRLLAAALALPSLLLWQGEALAAPDVDVLDYALVLEVDLKRERISGRAHVKLRSLRDKLTAVTLDAGALDIGSTRDARGGAALRTERRGESVTITLARPLPRGAETTLVIDYSGAPSRGLNFDSGQVYTTFHTDHWMPCVADPKDKATFTLTVALPAGLALVATGHPVSLPGSATHKWRTDTPTSAFLLGFAIGAFERHSATAGKVRLHAMAERGSRIDLKATLAELDGMIRFFERRAGVPYPHPRYTQVFLKARRVAQELSGLAFLPGAYADAYLKDRTEDWLIVHELAHQWWADAVTNCAWDHFWLHEGVVTFMVAAYKEERWGKHAYDREMKLARARVKKALDAGKSRPLVTQAWKTPEDMSGTITYSYGALVLDALRTRLGDDAFFEGLRAFTTTHVGSCATTEDLEAAMEKASGRDLDTFFEQMVYGEPNKKLLTEPLPK